MEYVRESRFKRYMGTDENAIIQLKDDLTRKPGDRVTFANVRKLRGQGVTGNQVLEGNEEELDSRSMAVTVGPVRNAVVVTDWDDQKSAIDLRNAGKTALKLWAMEKMRNQIIESLYSINGVLYTAATEVQKDAWLVDNADRVLFGAAVGNNSGNDHSASLANIDNTAAKLTTNVISLAKRRAQLASPAIKPIRLNEDEEWYVMFANSLSFRDLSKDPAMVQANRGACPRRQQHEQQPAVHGRLPGVGRRDHPRNSGNPGIGRRRRGRHRRRRELPLRRASGRRRLGAAHEVDDGRARLRLPHWCRRAGNPRHREAAVRQAPTTRPTSCNTAWSRCTPLPSRTHNALLAQRPQARRSLLNE